MWFEALTGFSEDSPQQVRENIAVEWRNPTHLAPVQTC
jgi:hypothetical protein